MTSSLHKHRPVFLVIFLLVLILSVIKMYHSFTHSLFFTQRDRINIIFYGKTPLYLSVGKDDSLHYVVPFYADLRVMVPGGYGYYRVGGIGKLAMLEKKPEILQRAFSTTTSTFVDYYFYPKEIDIYYGKEVSESATPDIMRVLFDNSNANVFDRLYLYFQFIGTRPNQFSRLDDIRTQKLEQGEVFSKSEFTKLYQGYFYQEAFRREKKNIQIQYSKSYSTASSIGELLEGDGIRVADITQVQAGTSGPCTITESGNSHSLTAKTLASFFKCTLKLGQTGVYDILFIMSQQEKDWDV